MAKKYIPIALSLSAIARELNCARDTAKTRMLSEEPDKNGCYSLQQVCDCFFDDTHKQKVELMRIQVQRNELKLKQEKRTLINTDDFVAVMESGLTAMRTICEHSSMTDSELAAWLAAGVEFTNALEKKIKNGKD
jgi:hypothetical protein